MIRFSFSNMVVEDNVRGCYYKVGVVKNIFDGCEIVIGGGESRVDEVGCFQGGGDVGTEELR